MPSHCALLCLDPCCLILSLFCSFADYAEALQSKSCKVNDSDISQSYVGSCIGGLAHGYGVAKVRDTYEGDFVKGNKSGNGIYRWANGDRYEGEYLDDKKNAQLVLQVMEKALPYKDSLDLEDIYKNLDADIIKLHQLEISKYEPFFYQILKKAFKQLFLNFVS